MCLYSTVQFALWVSHTAAPGVRCITDPSEVVNALANISLDWLTYYVRSTHSSIESRKTALEPTDSSK